MIIGDVARIDVGHEAYSGIGSNISRTSFSVGKTISESKRSSLQAGIEGQQETISPDSGKQFQLNHFRLVLGGEF